MVIGVSTVKATLYFRRKRRLKIPRREEDGVISQAGEAGLEPATYGFGDRCSAKLSYSPLLVKLSLVE